MDFKVYFWIFAFCFGVYAGFKFVPMYFHYYMMKYEIASIAKLAHKYEPSRAGALVLKKDILQVANEWYIPVNERNLTIELRMHNVDIKLEYEVELDFFGKYQHVTPFRIHSRERIVPTR
ncbi:MAG: hypothetical protein V3W31_02130 [Thermodesulfobacteriota bacterium]